MFWIDDIPDEHMKQNCVAAALRPAQRNRIDRLQPGAGRVQGPRLARLRRSSKPYRYQLRHARLLHSHPIKHGRNAHRLLAVRNEHELGLHAHVFHQLGERQ